MPSQGNTLITKDLTKKHSITHPLITNHFQKYAPLSYKTIACLLARYNRSEIQTLCDKTSINIFLPQHHHPHHFLTLLKTSRAADHNDVEILIIPDKKQLNHLHILRTSHPRTSIFTFMIAWNNGSVSKTSSPRPKIKSAKMLVAKAE